MNMHPYLLRIGSLSIPSYPVLYGLGITLAGVVLLILGGREGYHVRKLVSLVILLTLAILVGGRAFYVFQHIGEFRGKWPQAFDLSKGGQVLYGGLLLAIPCVIGYCKSMDLPLGRIFDLISVGTPLGLSVGRIGCFCRGCCYGALSDLCWSVQFPKHVDLAGNITGSPVFVKHLESGLITQSHYASLSVHPAQIYASITSLGAFFLMLYFYKNNILKGNLVFIYLIFYATSRFMLEYFRDNEVAFLDLTVPQVASAIIVFSSSMVLLRVSGIYWRQSCQRSLRIRTRNG